MKKAWREKGKEILHSFTQEEKNQLSKIIANHIFQTTWWKNAKTIGITISKPLELNTSFIIEQAWKEKKEVTVPKCYPKEDHKMIFYHLGGYDQLEVVYSNLLEPNPAVSKEILKEKIDLLFVPGLLFDDAGYRIGFGGGYYDRFLRDFHKKTVAIATSKQIVKTIPHEKYDLPVEQIVTEKGILI